jgi:hypothetical protein
MVEDRAREEEEERERKKQRAAGGSAVVDDDGEGDEEKEPRSPSEDRAQRHARAFVSRLRAQASGIDLFALDSPTRARRLWARVREAVRSGELRLLGGDPTKSMRLPARYTGVGCGSTVSRSTSRTTT